MRVIHKIDDFLKTIFPNINDDNQIVSVLEEFYSYNQFKPKVEIRDGFVIIDIDITSIANQESDFNKVISLCEKGQFSEAKPILIKLIEKNPTNSEYFRILGQVLSDEGEINEAINCLIDSLRWDSKNTYALLMMGNIFARNKDDIETAMRYYDQALEINPNDNIAINNIGANLLQQDKFEEAKKYFYKALELNSEYPNTHYALAMIAESEEDFDSALYSFIRTIKTSKKSDQLYKIAIQGAYQVSSKVIQSLDGANIYNKFRYILEKKGGVDIDIIIDNSIPTMAKIEFAENYNRDKHIIKFKKTNPSYPHLIMHELVHLDFVLDAKKEDNNLLFISTQQHKNSFIKTIESSLKNLSKRGMPDKVINEYSTDLFNGLNSLIFNAPIDLFIENYLYNEYPELRAFQFISLLNIVQEGKNSVTDKDSVSLNPKEIISKNKVYNLVNAYQFKDLYGVDFINEYDASKLELDQATKFYNEFLEYKDDKKPAEEYELVLHWAQDLKLDNNFELIGENQHRQRSNIDSFIETLEKDPFGVDEKDPVKEREMKIFLDNQKNIGINMAVVMFMIDAMQFFSNKSKEEIKRIGFEIAMQGTQGYRPEDTNYKLKSIPNKSFSGYHILAYYYVSWAIAIPEMLSQLQLPYDEEYKMALSMNKK
jgi:tetratricopeptide (TPR) repeat protein